MAGPRASLIRAQPTDISSGSPIDTSIYVRDLHSHSERSPGANQAQVDTAGLGADKFLGNAEGTQPDGVHICDKDLRRSRVDEEKPHDSNVLIQEVGGFWWWMHHSWRGGFVSGTRFDQSVPRDAVARVVAG